MINVVGDCHAAEGMLVEQIRYLMRLLSDTKYPSCMSQEKQIRQLIP